jgi:uncharacterized membrane protein YraQ (UPF0718 family)
MSKLKKALISAVKPLYRALPMILGVLLLIGLVSTLIPKSIITAVFSGNLFLDPLIAATLGSILAGNPVTSYVLGGELLTLGISLVAVAAFLVAWVTVGIVQLPAEMFLLGKKFAITRNVLSFIFSIIVAIITVLILGVI